MEMHYSRLSVPFAIWILLLMAMVLVGCKSAETPAPAELVIGLYVGTVLVIVEEYIDRKSIARGVTLPRTGIR